MWALPSHSHQQTRTPEHKDSCQATKHHGKREKKTTTSTYLGEKTHRATLLTCDHNELITKVQTLPFSFIVGDEKTAAGVAGGELLP